MRECGNCVHSRGSGADVWCGKGYTMYETYMSETNCPHYKSWSGTSDTVIDKITLNDGSSIPLNDIPDLIERQKIRIRNLEEISQWLYEQDGKRCADIFEIVEIYIKQFPEDSNEFKLLYNLAELLPINEKLFKSRKSK